MNKTHHVFSRMWFSTFLPLPIPSVGCLVSRILLTNLDYKHTYWGENKNYKTNIIATEWGPLMWWRVLVCVCKSWNSLSTSNVDEVNVEIIRSFWNNEMGRHGICQHLYYKGKWRLDDTSRMTSFKCLL